MTKKNKLEPKYVCKKCEAEISWGAIYCPNCNLKDPAVRCVGFYPTAKDL